MIWFWFLLRAPILPPPGDGSFRLTKLSVPQTTHARFLLPLGFLCQTWLLLVEHSAPTSSGTSLGACFNTSSSRKAPLATVWISQHSGCSSSAVLSVDLGGVKTVNSSACQTVQQQPGTLGHDYTPSTERRGQTNHRH